MATDSDVIERLRAHVEARHQEALAAIETLHAALNGLPRDDVPLSDQSFRACVLKVLTDDWQSIAAIAKASGVDTARVRGVLYAKSLLGTRCESRRVDGRIAFRRLAPIRSVDSKAKQILTNLNRGGVLTYAIQNAIEDFEGDVACDNVDQLFALTTPESVR